MKKFLKSDKAKKYNINEELINLVLSAPSLNQEKVERIKKEIANGTYQIKMEKLIQQLLGKSFQFCV